MKYFVRGLASSNTASRSGEPFLRSAMTRDSCQACRAVLGLVMGLG